MRARLSRFGGDETIQRLARRAETQITAFELPAGTTAFTDDLAPVEEITRRMLGGN